MSLITCGSIHKGHEWFSDSRGRRVQEIFMCLDALLCDQFCRFANGGAKILIKSYFMRLFFLSVFSSSEVLAKITSIRSKFADCSLLVSGKKREETVKPTCFMSKAVASVPQTPQTNHSQCSLTSSPVEALNLIVESKPQPVEIIR